MSESEYFFFFFLRCFFFFFDCLYFFFFLFRVLCLAINSMAAILRFRTMAPYGTIWYGTMVRTNGTRLRTTMVLEYTCTTMVLEYVLEYSGQKGCREVPCHGTIWYHMVWYHGTYHIYGTHGTRVRTTMVLEYHHGTRVRTRVHWTQGLSTFGTDCCYHWYSSTFGSVI